MSKEFVYVDVEIQRIYGYWPWPHRYSCRISLFEQRDYSLFISKAGARRWAKRRANKLIKPSIPDNYKLVIERKKQES